MRADCGPMPGMEPEDIMVEVTAHRRLLLHGDLRDLLKEVTERLLDEESTRSYHRESDL